MNINKLAMTGTCEPTWFVSDDRVVVTNGHVALVAPWLEQDGPPDDMERLDLDVVGEHYLTNSLRGTVPVDVDRTVLISTGWRRGDMFCRRETDDTLAVMVGPALVALGYVALVEAVHPGCQWHAPEDYREPENCMVVATVDGKPVAAVMPRESANAESPA